MQAIRERWPTPPHGFMSQLGETTLSDSELSTVSSSRFLGLDDEWWKENQTVGSDDGGSDNSGNDDGGNDDGGSDGNDGGSDNSGGDSSRGYATVTTRSQRKRVHWE